HFKYLTIVDHTATILEMLRPNHVNRLVFNVSDMIIEPNTFIREAVRRVSSVDIVDDEGLIIQVSQTIVDSCAAKFHWLKAQPNIATSHETETTSGVSSSDVNPIIFYFFGRPNYL
ncbi:hypothetical protein PENTCL1PPCAC_4505, partial [Pristionchus entomophagus]